MISLMNVKDDPTEEAMLIEAAQQNPAAFETLYRHWVIPLYHYVYVRVGNTADAEDITSQVMLSAYQGLPRYQHRGFFAGWLFTIARNQTWRWLAREKREVPFTDVPISNPEADLANSISKMQEIKRLREIVFALPENERELIYLRYVACLRFADMGVVLNRSEAAIKKALYRLQRRMYSLLEDSNE
jgi:RNA polymerase sigma-70 factor (ECF subfamily)